jgi:hypothetical protein
MHPIIQTFGVIAGATIGAALSSALVGWFGASILDVCDPKFGCTFGFQFGAFVSGILGLLASFGLIFVAAAYTAISHNTLPPKLTLQLASGLGVAIGTFTTVAALASYR